MAKWGKFDFSEFRNMSKNFEKAINGNVVSEFIRDFLLEMAYRAERKIKKRTPVAKRTFRIKRNDKAEKITFKKGKRAGEYKTETTHVGGQLRRGWTVGQVTKQGNTYLVEIYNNTEYAPFVEFGHRAGARLTKWVEGRFMMTISMQEIERELPKYLAKRQKELLERLLSGKPPEKGDQE